MFGSRTKALRMGLCIGAALCGWTTLQAQSLLQTTGNVIAYSGADVPGLPGVTFGGIATFDNPVLDEDGFVLFRGRMVGAGVVPQNERALFRGSTASDLAIVIRGMDPAPGLPGLTLNSAFGLGIGGTYRVSPDGRTMWGSFLSGPGVTTANDTALFGGFPAGLGLIAREGDAAPGTVGASFSSAFDSPSQQNTGITRNDHVLFKSTLIGGDVSGTTNNEGWITGMAGGLSMMVRKGDTVTGDGATAASLGLLSQMTNDGRVLYNVTLGGTATPANNASVWIHTPGAGNTIVVREGDSAPGTAGATFNNAASTWNAGVSGNNFTRSGNVLFQADLLGGDVVAGVNDRAIYEGSTGGLTQVLRRGDSAPATDANFSIFNNNSLGLNDARAIAFQALVVGGTATAATDTGIWAGMPDALGLIVREGDLAPGTSGAVFADLTGQSMSFNDLGQVLFHAPLTGGDVVPATHNALYAWDPGVGLIPVVRGGDVLEIAPGVFRTVSGFGGVPFNNTDGAALGFGHDATAALHVSFLNNEAAIVTFVIPEPASLALLAIGAVLLTRRRSQTCDSKWIISPSRSSLRPFASHGACPAAQRRPRARLQRG